MNDVGFRPRGKITHSDQAVSVSLVAPLEKTLLHRWLSFLTWHRLCTYAFGPDSWSGSRDWLHKCNTSHHHFLPGASSIIVGPYWGPCWHSSYLLMIHHVVRSARLLGVADEVICWSKHLRYDWYMIYDIYSLLWKPQIWYGTAQMYGSMHISS